ncbi:MAG: peptidoglycan-binding protein [Candidatus Eisenbacteria bacterium]|uniref:Peptidoglycan-binding protein n=1 Tax=Eiseniibacteriota bacterium TaxID=2212470 RepID=A0A948RYD7_UNCEI|nr:peptidoglycan-binding protein [Candidatus Eisenbacteria bacterium]MBU1949181.1 peptidoglycan-binding protein [Candidatus Eisenbacteria bacterium]MBU2691859.1 peptidoglycan-binding protein [Candidatus Eisenbacteria bacterium]
MSREIKRIVSVSTEEQGVMSRVLFEQAIEFVLEHEGEVLNDHPEDRGGPTKFGISQQWNPDVNVRELTREQAIDIYWQRYWLGHGYEQLPEPVASKVFDLAVNLGDQTAVICLQRALRACGLRVKVDGLLGLKTCGASRRADAAALMAALRSEAAGEYRLRVARDADQAAFRDGWLNRAYS